MDFNTTITIIIVGGALAAVTPLTIMAWFTHRERMAAIKAGFNPFTEKEKVLCNDDEYS